MKSIICIIALNCLFIAMFAQNRQDRIKPSTLVFHGFYNDFNTAQKLKAGSHGWGNIADMQMGVGFSYLKGIVPNIDLAASVDGSYTDYLFKNGTTFGSSQFLLDVNTILNFKLLTDRHAVVPFILGGAGVSAYQGKTGAFVPTGAGLQFNLFSEAFLIANMQYRFALTHDVNDHFQYSVGFGVSIGKKKKAPVPATPVVPVAAVPVAAIIPTAPVEAANIVKNLAVKVSDQQTGLPLPFVEVTLVGPESKLTAFSDAHGLVTFIGIKAADYKVGGILHGISTTTQSVPKNSFDTSGEQINIAISHNDPRFTLAGIVRNKGTQNPESGVMISLTNASQNVTVVEQNGADGAFNVQLTADADFTISGKKASYISNIEKVSTKGLNRSATLYVKLELGVEEARRDQAITLANIYYDKGSTNIRAGASTDLQKLVNFLKDNPNLSIEIASHTDSRGSNAVNLKLSQARAQQVANYLQKAGISKTRLKPKGYGETQLINGCANGVKCTEAQHEQNRRTEFKVVSL